MQLTSHNHHSSSALENFFQKKHTHAGSLVNTTLPACYIYVLSPFPSNLIRASSAASTPSATLFPATCLVLGGSSPSLIPATGFAFASGLANPPRLYTLHHTLYTKKSHSPCAYAIFLLPLRSNLLHHIYYENNHHYLSSNYGTQVLSSLWCCIYLPARESRQVPMCRRGTLARCSCTSGCAIPQPMPLPQVPIGVLYLGNLCLLSRMIFGYSLPLNSKL